MILKSLWWLMSILKWSYCLELSVDCNIIGSVDRHSKEIWIPGNVWSGIRVLKEEAELSFERSTYKIHEISHLKQFLYGPDTFQFKGEN